MKKIICFMILIPVLLCAAALGEPAPERQLTVMVYMCGSNLESSAGSATADIQEMKDSVPGGGAVSVLVMTGGSRTEEGSVYFQDSSAQIHEIASGRSRRIWQSPEPMNMGDTQTLTQLLRTGLEQYPAREYALILWDHGGGPLGGVCWDELFSMDNLSLQEVTQALDAAGLPGKLSWIGFDACLMCSTEVASAMAPYAQYMIASQETEPASGWDYSFLREIAQDEDGAATGRRIIDGYFQSLEGSGDILTMACVDLNKIGAVTEQMDLFFEPIGEQLNRESFALLSGLRMATVSFGKSVRGIGSEGYDLVDLKDLITHYGRDSEGIRKALEEAIVYSRSNEKGVNGLSVYHPYVNKSEYVRAWKSDYQKLDFSDAYVRYTERFGSMLLENPEVDWSGLRTLDLGFDENGNHLFSLRLTPEQQEDLVSARLMILKDPESSIGGYQKHLAPMAETEALLTEDGRLTAEYPGRVLYVVDEQNKVLAGPVCYFLGEDDGQTLFVLAQYDDYSGRIGAKPTTTVLYCCEVNDAAGDLKILRKYVYDQASKSYTNRIAFSEEDFTDVIFHYLLRQIPATDGVIPGFSSWKSFEGYLALQMDLPVRWHFRMTDYRQPSGMYAMFQLTDSRQNVYSSIPIRIENPSEQFFSLEPDTVETDACTLRFTAVTNRDDVRAGLRLMCEMTNRSNRKLRAEVGRIVLNGELSSPEEFNFTGLEPGASELIRVTLSGDALTGLSEVNRIEAVLEVSDYDDWSAEPETTAFSIAVEGCDVSSFASPRPATLAEYEQEDGTWQLLKLTQREDGTIYGLLYFFNDSEEPQTVYGTVSMNDVYLADSFRGTAQPHTGCYIPFEAENRETLSYFTLHIADRNNLYLMSMDRILQNHGVLEIDRIDFHRGLDTYSDGTGTVTMTLPEPLVLSGQETEPPERIPLLTGEISAELEGVFAADDGIALAVHFRNDTDRTVLLEPLSPAINGVTGEFHYAQLRMPPHTQAVKFLIVKTDQLLEEKAALREMEFFFRTGNRDSAPVRILFPEGTTLGAGGGSYLTPDMLTVEGADWPEMTMLMADAVLLPEEPVESITVTAPLSEEEQERVEWVNVSICLLTREKAADGLEYPVTRTIAKISLEPDPEGRYSTVFSGLALTADGQLLSVNERRREDGSVRMESSDLYFYRNAEDLQPTGAGLFWDGGYHLKSDIDLTVDTASGTVKLLRNDTRLNNETDWRDGRTNFPLTEAALAVIDRRVFFGTDRMKNVYTIDYSEAIPLPLESSVQLALIPVSQLDGELCLYYAMQFTDGSRGDRIADWNTGEILDRIPEFANQL